MLDSHRFAGKLPGHITLKHYQVLREPCPSQAGAVTSIPSTTASVIATEAYDPPALSAFGAQAGEALTRSLR